MVLSGAGCDKVKELVGAKPDSAPATAPATAPAQGSQTEAPVTHPAPAEPPKAEPKEGKKPKAPAAAHDEAAPQDAALRGKLKALAVASRCMQKAGKTSEEMAQTMFAQYKAFGVSLEQYTAEMAKLANDQAFQAEVQAAVAECPGPAPKVAAVDSGAPAPTQPTDTGAKPADPTAKPADTAAKPADTAAKPADTAAKPADTAAKPADAAAKPADAAAKPADTAAKPADAAAKPADAAAKPADTAAKPADAAAKPADAAAKPADAATKPADAAAKPAEAKPKPPTVSGGTFKGSVSGAARGTITVKIRGGKASGSATVGATRLKLHGRYAGGTVRLQGRAGNDYARFMGKVKGKRLTGSWQGTVVRRRGEPSKRSSGSWSAKRR